MLAFSGPHTEARLISATAPGESADEHCRTQVGLTIGGGLALAEAVQTDMRRSFLSAGVRTGIGGVLDPNRS